MTTTTEPTCTWTNFKGEWMIRSDVKLGHENTIGGEIQTIGGKQISVPGSVEVSSKSGSVKIVRVGEYEKCFKNTDGTETHIYSVRNA